MNGGGPLRRGQDLHQPHGPEGEPLPLRRPRWASSGWSTRWAASRCASRLRRAGRSAALDLKAGCQTLEGRPGARVRPHPAPAVRRRGARPQPDRQAAAVPAGRDQSAAGTAGARPGAGAGETRPRQPEARRGPDDRRSRAPRRSPARDLHRRRRFPRGSRDAGYRPPPRLHQRDYDPPCGSTCRASTTVGLAGAVSAHRGVGGLHPDLRPDRLLCRAALRHRRAGRRAGRRLGRQDGRRPGLQPHACRLFPLRRSRAAAVAARPFRYFRNAHLPRALRSAGRTRGPRRPDGAASSRQLRRARRADGRDQPAHRQGA